MKTLQFYRISSICFRAKSVNERNHYGGSALIVAALHNNVEIAQYLIRKKAEVNARTNKGYSSLHVAAKNGFTTITELLIDKGTLNSFSAKEGTIFASFVLQGTDFKILHHHQCHHQCFMVSYITF